MIVREQPRLIDLISALQGSVLPRILPRILGVTVLSLVLVALDRFVLRLPHTNAAPFAMFGVALSLFLGFRNNAAYERWWEGRKLWGQLIADLRSLARECEMFLPENETRNTVLYQALTFLHLHRINLRKLPLSRLPLDLPCADYSNSAHPPCAALNDLNASLSQAAPDGFAKRALSERLGRIALAQAGCERLASTPLPFVYSLLIFRTAYLYCLLVPFALLDSAGWMTPLFVAIVAYVFFGLAEVAEELAQPFGETVNGLALDAMCRTVEISYAPYLGTTPPPPLKAQNYYLS